MRPSLSTPSKKIWLELRAELPRALRAQGHAVAETLVVRPPVVLGVVALARHTSALGADQWFVGVGHAAEATPAGEVVGAALPPPPWFYGPLLSSEQFG